MLTTQTHSTGYPRKDRRAAASNPTKKISAERLPAARAGVPRVQSATRLVRDLMIEKVFTLSPQDDLATLYDLMDFRRIRHIPVVEEDGELVGLVTSADLSRGALGRIEELPLSAERDLLRRRRVLDIMSCEPDTIAPDADLREAAEMLLENKIGCLPVVEGLQLVGILTEADFVRDYLEKE